MVKQVVRDEVSPQMRALIFGRVVAAMKIGIDAKIARDHFKLNPSLNIDEQLRSLASEHKMRLKKSAIEEARKQFQRLIQKAI